MKIRTEQSDELTEDVSMSPLVDCVFLLLIFFLVATFAKKENRDIDVSLPQVETALKVRPSDETLVIGVDRNGDLFWQGDPCTRGWLHDRLRILATDGSRRRIRIDADKNAPFVHLAEAINVCEFHRFQDVSLRTYDRQYNNR